MAFFMVDASFETLVNYKFSLLDKRKCAQCAVPSNADIILGILEDN